MSNAVATNIKSAILYSRSTFIVYFLSILLVYRIINLYFFEKSISLFNGLIYSNINNLVFILFIFLLSFCIITLTSFYPVNFTKNHNELDYTNNIDNKTKSLFNLKEIFQIERDHYKIIEYPLITQFIIIGGVTLLSSNDLITIFLSIELQSYGLYILSTIYRNSEASTGAGLTYFLLGGLSSCIILLGLSFLYINSGTTSLDGLYLIYNIITSDVNLLSVFLVQNNELFNTIGSNLPVFSLNYYQYTIQLSLVVLTVGFLFKISAAPFHS
jgi:NADH-ubiquinone oxidoreductase chain 2